MSKLRECSLGQLQRMPGHQSSIPSNLKFHQSTMQIRVPRHPPTHYQSPSHFNPYFFPPRGAPAQYPHPRYPPQHFHPQFVPHPLIHDPPHRTSTPHSPTLQPTYAAMAHPHKPALSNPRPVQQTSQKVPACITQSLDKDTQHQRSQNARSQNKETQHQRPRSVHQTQSSPNLNKETQHQKPNPAPAKLNKTHQPIPQTTASTHKYQYPISLYHELAILE